MTIVHMLTNDWLHEVFPGVLVRSNDQWRSIRFVMRYQLHEDIGGCVDEFHGLVEIRH